MVSAFNVTFQMEIITLNWSLFNIKQAISGHRHDINIGVLRPLTTHIHLLPMSFIKHQMLNKHRNLAT
jgi:hypothetical protein